MRNYANGKIYKIWSPKTDMVYIGATTQPLSKRCYGHKIKFQYYCEGNEACYLTSFEIIDIDPDFRMDLIEEYPCENKEQLNRREGEIILQHVNSINRIVSGRTRKEYRTLRHFCDVCKVDVMLNHRARHEKSKTHIENCQK